jgi:excisionase family DNA binding protein
MSDALLRPEDVAEHLAVSKVTVYRLARSGDLPSVRIRGQVRFRPEALDDFLARAEAEAEAEAETEADPSARPRGQRRGRPRHQWVPPDAA